jgi:hypothetical protein
MSATLEGDKGWIILGNPRQKGGGTRLRISHNLKTETSGANNSFSVSIIIRVKMCSL